MLENFLKPKSALKTALFSLLFSLIFSFSAFSQSHNESEEQEPFDPGKLIMEHVLDSHEWHVFSVGSFHATVPLPVILYSPDHGFDMFLSSKFHHGEKSYAGYSLEEGHIIREDKATFYDFSLTKTVMAMWVSMIIMCWVLISIARTYQKKPNEAPKGIQSLMEPLIIFVRDEIAKPSIGEDRYEKYLPYILTIFFFIWFNNILGLIPIIPFGANVTGNIAIPIVLATFTFVITTASTNKGYWIHIFNTPGVPWWLKFPIPIMPVVEFLSIWTKPFVLVIRLFANITAGHIIALVFMSMIFIFAEKGVAVGYSIGAFSTLFNIVMSFLELLVAFIQAYVFTLLSALYFGIAKVEEHH